jgi:hypothetical protein
VQVRRAPIILLSVGICLAYAYLNIETLLRRRFPSPYIGRVTMVNKMQLSRWLAKQYKFMYQPATELLARNKPASQRERHSHLESGRENNGQRVAPLRIRNGRKYTLNSTPYRFLVCSCLALAYSISFLLTFCVIHLSSTPFAISSEGDSFCENATEAPCVLLNVETLLPCNTTTHTFDSAILNCQTKPVAIPGANPSRTSRQ